MRARIIKAGQGLLIEQKPQRGFIVLVANVGVKTKAFVVGAHHVQHEVGIITQHFRKQIKSLALCIRTRCLTISTMVPLNPSHDIGHGLAIPFTHGSAVENQQATVANHQRIRKAFAGFPTGEVATGSAMHPLLAIQRHPFGVIEQCHATFAILVLFRDQLGG